MPVCLAAFLVLCWCACPVRADDKPGQVILDTWNSIYMGGQHAGWVNTVTRVVERNGARLRTQTELQLTMLREQDVIRQTMVTGTEETPEGKVTGVFMHQEIGQEQMLVLLGDIKDGQLFVHIDTGKADGGKRLVKPWNDDAIGQYAQDQLFKKRKVKPGDQFSFLSFEPTVDNLITTQVRVIGFETVGTLNGQKKLLRVEMTPDNLVVGEQSVQLPKMVEWLDENYDTIRSQVDVPGLGMIVQYKSTKEVAKRPVSGSQMPNINALIPLNYSIVRPYAAEEAMYRITFKGEGDPTTAFARDARQRIQDVKGNTFDLVVKATRPSQKKEIAAPAGKEFLESNYFIKSDDDLVRRLAQTAVGSIADPWQKSLAIERYVHGYITNKNMKNALATADETARKREGDCTEHAMLAAAMCRAAGVPSRTALGLIYVEPQGRPSLGFHMWTEVYINGEWLEIDATLGHGFVGASHLKISDHSWHDEQGLKPLFPVLRVLGKLNIEVKWVQPGPGR